MRPVRLELSAVGNIQTIICAAAALILSTGDHYVHLQTSNRVQNHSPYCHSEVEKLLLFTQVQEKQYDCRSAFSRILRWHGEILDQIVEFSRDP
jgi:hypothetical protein